jgi:hypothetical protein
MTDRQRENLAKYLYDMSKGIGLIGVVGGLVSGQATLSSVILSVITAGLFLVAAYVLERGRDESA